MWKIFSCSQGETRCCKFGKWGIYLNDGYAMLRYGGGINKGKTGERGCLSATNKPLAPFAHTSGAYKIRIPICGSGGIERRSETLQTCKCERLSQCSPPIHFFSLLPQNGGLEFLLFQTIVRICARTRSGCMCATTTLTNDASDCCAQRAVCRVVGGNGLLRRGCPRSHR
jgi:hypothetical protein